jgi:predicted tellurium resistance membrane protein TerC
MVKVVDSQKPTALAAFALVVGVLDLVFAILSILTVWALLVIPLPSGLVYVHWPRPFLAALYVFKNFA